MTARKTLFFALFTFMCATECKYGKHCNNDSCRFSHPLTEECPRGKVFRKLTPCNGSKHCPGGGHSHGGWVAAICPYLHQCPNEKVGRRRCRDPDCQYDHLNNIKLNQEGLVHDQGKGGTCQSHALAAYLTNWIETSTQYKEVAHRYRCQAEGHRLYDVIFKRLSHDFETRFRSSPENMDQWYARMVRWIIPSGRVHNITGEDREDRVRHTLAHRDMPLLFRTRMTKERYGAFSAIRTWGDRHEDAAFNRFLSMKNSRSGKSDRELPGHCMLCVPDPTRGGFAIKNSWGKDWADKGVVYLRPNQCKDDMDFTFTVIEIPDDAKLNPDFFL